MEVSYNKTINENVRKANLAAELRTEIEPPVTRIENDSEEINNENRMTNVTKQRTITEFFVRGGGNNGDDEDELNISSQEMIEDARARRKIREKHLQCPDCEYKTRSQTMLKRHVQDTHVEKMNASNDLSIARVEEEEETTISSQEMIEDARIRRNIRDKDLQCQECEYKTRSQSMLRRHLEKHHDTNLNAVPLTRTSSLRSRLSCNVCDFKTTSQAVLKDHIEKKHGLNNEKSTLACNQCNKKYKKEHTLKKHKETTHRAENLKENLNENENEQHMMRQNP